MNYTVIHNSLTHYKKSVHLVTCDTRIERETLQVCLYVPLVLSCGRQGRRLSENGDVSREDILRA
jgi:hypothetical protein